jgi:hypothetical protein
LLDATTQSVWTEKGAPSRISLAGLVPPLRDPPVNFLIERKRNALAPTLSASVWLLGHIAITGTNVAPQLKRDMFALYYAKVVEREEGSKFVSKKFSR